MRYSVMNDPEVRNRRTDPTVPGINADRVKPNIGAGDWSRKGRKVRNGKVLDEGKLIPDGSRYFKARPCAGRPSDEWVGGCTDSERREMAIAYAETLARGAGEIAVIGMAQDADPHNRAMARVLALKLGSGQDRRKQELAGVIAEILNY